MNLTEIQNNLIGAWTGNNLLRFMHTDHNSSSDLSVAHVAKGRFLTFTYTWSYENTDHEGLLTLGYDAQHEVATAAWVDSWHMSSKVWSCQGVIDQQGVIDLRGSYAAPPGPDWGWRIVITAPPGKDLQIVMYNCSPEGVEELAVRADYKRI
jgi:Protein of unknown function (DUF1579)